MEPKIMDSLMGEDGYPTVYFKCGEYYFILTYCDYGMNYVPYMPMGDTEKAIKEHDQDFLIAYAKVMGFFTRDRTKEMEKNFRIANEVASYDPKWVENEDIMSALNEPLLPGWEKRSMIENCEWVYLVGNDDEKKYKIGMTRRFPSERIKEFSPLLPFSSEIFARCPTTNAYKLEQELHKMFADKRLNGEWFELSEGDVVYIRSMSI